MTNFHDLGLSEDILRALDSEGYDNATAIQVRAIPDVIAGRDLMGNAQTGTGKTAAFALPTLQRLSQRRRPPPVEGLSPQERQRQHSRRQRSHHRRPIRALVLAPTRELAAQIDERFKAYGRFTGLHSTVIFGGVGQRPQVQAIRRGVDILVATPGRLEDLMQQRIVSLRAVEVLILDEADHMLDIGFIHALKRIVKTVPDQRQTLMFSATMPREIRELSKEWLTDPVHVQVAPASTPAEDVEQSVYFVGKKQKPRLLEAILRELPGNRSLVFSRTKYGADKVVKHLKRGGLPSVAIHGNKSQGQRQRALEQFRSGHVSVLVATDIAARGLDIQGVSHVFNLDLPEVAEVYVHRIGRTGRAGATGVAISFCSGAERAQLKDIEKLIRRNIQVECTPEDLRSAEADPPPAAAVPSRSKRVRTRNRKAKGDTPWRNRTRPSRSAAGSEPSESAARKKRDGKRREKQGSKPETTRPYNSETKRTRPKKKRRLQST